MLLFRAILVEVKGDPTCGRTWVVLLLDLCWLNIGVKGGEIIVWLFLNNGNIGVKGGEIIVWLFLNNGNIGLKGGEIIVWLFLNNGEL
jgi:hypothetical protein